MAQQITSGFAPGDDQTVVEILGKWDGGPLSPQLFTVLAGMIPQPIVEVVVLRMFEPDMTVQTLLIPRPVGDPIWPGKLHNPGAAFRKGDFLRQDGTPLNGPFDRIQHGELGQMFEFRPQFAGKIHRMTLRGAEVVEVYVAVISSDAPLKTGHEWVDVDALPNRADFIQHQLEHVQIAANHYRVWWHSYPRH